MGKAMTEAEWNRCDEPGPMLKFLGSQRASERKLRLSSCACCRTVWDSIQDERFRDAVTAAEQFADGLISATDLNELRKTLGATLDQSSKAGVSGPVYCVLECAWSTTKFPVISAAIHPTWVLTD